MNTGSFGLWLEVLGVFVAFAAFFTIVGFGIKLASDDAERRGKSPVLVAIACILFFPWGLVAWLIFRPDPLNPTDDLSS